MVRLRGCLIGFQVTAHALDAERIKPPRRPGNMASLAISQLMAPRQRKPALPVYFTDVLNDPCLWRMTPRTVRPQRGFMKILMAINALAFYFRKLQRFMARPAVYRLVLPNQFIARTVMIK